MICLLLTLSDPRPGLFKTIQTFQLPWTYLQEMQICILGSISNFWAGCSALYLQDCSPFSGHWSACQDILGNWFYARLIRILKNLPCFTSLTESSDGEELIEEFKDGPDHGEDIDILTPSWAEITNSIHTDLFLMLDFLPVPHHHLLSQLYTVPLLQRGHLIDNIAIWSWSCSPC